MSKFKSVDSYFLYNNLIFNNFKEQLTIFSGH